MVIRLVLVGETATGKSSTGNSILGQYVFPISTKGIPTTRTCAAGETTRFGTKFVVIDTPGYFFGSDIDIEIKKCIQRCVELAHPGPQVFLFVFSCNSRYCENDVCVINWFKDFFGEDIYKHSVIVFTSKNSKLCKNSISKFLKSSPKELRDLIERCGNRLVAVDNASPNELDADIRKIIGIVVDLVNDLNLHHLDFDTVNNNSASISASNVNSNLDKDLTTSRSSTSTLTETKTMENMDKSTIRDPSKLKNRQSIHFEDDDHDHDLVNSEQDPKSPNSEPQREVKKCLFYDCSDELVKQQIMVLGRDLADINSLKEKITEEAEIRSAANGSDVDSWCDLAESGVSLATQFDQLLNDIFRDESHLLSPFHHKRSLTRKGAVRKSKH